MENKLILGDNIEILKSLPSDSVDLIYIDPPFFSNKNYEVIWGDEGEIRSFKDRWSGGIDHYIGWLYERVEEMYRILKKTGSFYLHCDWHADAYIRVYILDKIFGHKNFRNEIVWSYKTGGSSKNFFSRKHDLIYFYSKSKEYYFKSQKEKAYTKAINRKPGIINYGEGNAEFFKDEFGIFNIVNMRDVWDISYINSQAKERIGYPTQKPEALLERIIKASSNEGDVVLDAFCGGGTTLAVADKLNRHWIGIDQSVQAIKVSEARLQKQQDLYSNPFEVKLHKYDYDTLRNKDAFDFETWIVEQFGGESNEKQRSDSGVDGKKDGVPIQVKRSDHIGRNVVDNFKSAIGRYYGSAKLKNRLNDKITDGYIIAFSFGKGAVQEVARLKLEEGLQIELILVDSIVPIASRPKLEISFKDLGLDDKQRREIECTATTQADTKGELEFYQWDFNYDPKQGFKAGIMIDKEGKQIQKFTAGKYTVACKIIDTEGLESMETMQLKINGTVKRLDSKK